MKSGTHGPGPGGRRSGSSRARTTFVHSNQLVALMWDASDAVHFVDSEGTPWRVTERDTSETPGARADSCLIFLAEGMARRSWRVPRGWRELPAPALEQLMHGGS